MQILLLSFHVPTDATPEASRAYKIARFLVEQGHDVRVLCSPDVEHLGFGAAKLSETRIVLTPSEEEFAALAGQTVRGRISRLYGAKRGTDRARDWHKAAITTATELFETWKPDVIYAMCPPHSTALIAAQLSRVSEIPFVTDFSERWADDASESQADRRKQKDAQKERDILKRAAAIVTSSPVWAESYANKYGAEKVTLAMDGFDSERYPLSSPTASDKDRKILRLLYTLPAEGSASNLGTLFEGINALGAGAKDIRLTLVGENIDAALELALEGRLEKQVDLIPTGTREDAVKRQYGADVVILAVRNDIADAGLVPAELFDYIGARRPIIALGYSKGAAAEIVRKRDLGVWSNEPKVIANRLSKLLTKKRAVGVVPFLPEAVRENASMASQFSPLEPMFYSVVGTAPVSIAAE